MLQARGNCQSCGIITITTIFDSQSTLLAMCPHHNVIIDHMRTARLPSLHRRSTHDDESLPEKRTEEVKHMLRSILAKRMFNEVSPTDETLSILISVVAGATEAVSEAHIVTPPPLGSASASSSSDKEEEQTEHDLSSHIDVPVSVVEHAPVEEVDVVTTAEE